MSIRLVAVICVVVLLAFAGPLAAGQVRVTDAFDGSGTVNWCELTGQWSVRDGVYHLSGTGQSYVEGVIYDEVTVEVSCRINRYLAIPQDWVGIMFGGDGRTLVANTYQVYIRYSGEVELYKLGKILAVAQTGAGAKFAAGEFVRLGVTVKNRQFFVRVDGETLIEHAAPDYTPGCIGLAGFDVEADFDDFVADGQALGNAITGEVLMLPSMLPVPGAKVEIYNSTDGYDSPVTRSTVTDDRGRYSFSDLPAGEKAYWLRAAADGLGGTTGWFVTVVPEKPTTVDLCLLGPPRHDIWIDSANLARTGGPAGSGFEHFAEPQCFGGSRIQVKKSWPASRRPQWWAEFEFSVEQEGEYVPWFAAGLYPYPHYWSDYWWSLDGKGPYRASKTLTIDGPRYGDRGQMTWAYAAPVHLSAGRHRLRFTLRDPAPHNVAGDMQPYWWALDAAAFAQMPSPIWPAKGCVVSTSRPVLRWQAPKSAARFTVQVSCRPDFSNGTITLGGVTNSRLTLAQPLADGTYYWRVKALEADENCYFTPFSRPERFVVATPAPAIGNLRVISRTPTSATIEWETDEPCTARLHYGLSALRFDREAPAEHVGGGVHRARLTGLAPMTYYYFAAEATNRAGARSISLRQGFCTPRGVIADYNSPFGIFGQGLIYSRQLGAAGARWYSDYWEWGRINPARGAYDWEQPESRMKRARESGVNLLVTFWGTPAWVRPGHPDDFTYGPDDLEDARILFRAVAEHCRGRCEWWLPWIEPNVARDPVFGFPRGYWANRPHARSYAAYQRAAYEGFKAGNPDCRVVGMNTAGVDLDFIRRCYDEGAADSFDVMNVHYYAINAPFEEQQPEALFARLRALMAEYGDAEKPILCSEGGGASSGLEGTNEDTQADNIVRIFVISIANNIDKLCWTFELDEKPYGSKRVDMIMWMGLFRFDPRTSPENPAGEPKPSYYAFRTMTQNLYGTEYAGPVKLGAGVRAYRFVGPNKQVTVLWAEKGEADVAVPVAAKQVTVIDRQGREKQLASRQGKVRLHLTGSPRYVIEQ